MKLIGKEHGNNVMSVFEGDTITSTTICGKIIEKIPVAFVIENFWFKSGSVEELETWLFHGGTILDEFIV